MKWIKIEGVWMTSIFGLKLGDVDESWEIHALVWK